MCPSAKTRDDLLGKQLNLPDQLVGWRDRKQHVLGAAGRHVRPDLLDTILGRPDRTARRHRFGWKLKVGVHQLRNGACTLAVMTGVGQHQYACFAWIDAPTPLRPVAVSYTHLRAHET